MSGLREGAGIPGFNEGVLAHLLPVLLSAVQQHYARHMQKTTTMLGSVDEEFFTTGIKNLFGKAFVETMGEGRWLDKTPGGPAIIKACPALLEIFPNVTFIFCQRRGIENVLSRQSKFPSTSFENHCVGWASTMQTWLEVGPQLGDRAVVVDQRDMGLDPEAVSARIAALLELSDEEREGLHLRLRSKRLEQTRPIQDERPISITETGWSEADQETFRRICGPMMAAFGYDLEEHRPAVVQSSYQFFVPVADGIAELENVSTRKACQSVGVARFKIDPNPAGAPAAGIRHRMIEMDRFREFTARLRCVEKPARNGAGLIFSFALQRSSDGACAFFAERTVMAGPPTDWRCELPRLSGQHDAVLSVRPVSATSDVSQLSGLWIDAQLG
jgi:hypothetical protein